MGDINADHVTIQLYPNPFKSFTAIKVEGALNGTLELNVFDMTGRRIAGKTTDNNTFSIERGQIQSGVYFYEISQNGKKLGNGMLIAE